MSSRWYVPLQAGLALAVAIALAALFFWLWKIAPKEDRVFNFTVAVGVIGALLLTAVGLAWSIWSGHQSTRRQDQQLQKQSTLLQRLVERAELKPSIAAMLLAEDGDATDALEVQPDWSEREEPGVIEETVSRRWNLAYPLGTGGVLKRYRPASDLQRIRMGLANEGAVRANRILATVRLPAGVEAFDEDEFYEQSSLLVDTRGLLSAGIHRHFWGIDVPEDEDGQRDRSRFELGADELGNDRELTSFKAVWLRFPKTEDTTTYELKCEVVADGIAPQETSFVITVRS